MTRVLVTGGGGFIGRQVVGMLREHGDTVTVLDLQYGDDVRDLRTVRSMADGVDVIVHLAAKVGLGVRLDDIDDYVSANDLGTAVMLRAAGVGHIVVASSMVVYGDGAYRCPDHGAVVAPARSRKDLSRGLFEPRCRCGAELTPGLVDESAPFDPRNAYAASKVQTEYLTRVWARETGGSATALRFHNVYGPGMPRDTPYAGVAALFRAATIRGEPPLVFEDGQQRRDFVHVHDVARAVLLSVHRPGPAGQVTAYNVGSGTVTTVGELATLIAGMAGGPEPVTTGRYRLGDVRHITASSARITRDLGWRPTVDLRSGLAVPDPVRPGWRPAAGAR